MTEFRIDWDRGQRCGTSEAVLCDPKSAAQVDAIVVHAAELGRRLFLTRLSPRKLSRLSPRARELLDYDTVTRTAILGGLPPTQGERRVAIVCGGTSDLPVAGEAARTLAFAGEAATLLADVGVAGLWRLVDRIEEIRQHRVVIAVAGMEGALFSVLTGLVRGAVIAVPTSVRAQRRARELRVGARGGQHRQRLRRGARRAAHPRRRASGFRACVAAHRAARAGGSAGRPSPNPGSPRRASAAHGGAATSAAPPGRGRRT